MKGASNSQIVGSSVLQMFCQISVLKKPEKFTRKHMCRSLVFNKVAGCKIVQKLTKKRLSWSLVVNKATV